MFAIVKIFFWSVWLAVILIVTGIRICFILLKIMTMLVIKAVGRERGKGYKVKYNG